MDYQSKVNGNQLNLSEHDINDNQLKEVIELFANSDATEFHMSFNEITDTGAQYLADMLKAGSSVEKLFLGKNKITETGANALIDALPNSNIKELCLTGNKVCSESICGFRENNPDVKIYMNCQNS